jgi:hypothetical protein
MRTMPCTQRGPRVFGPQGKYKLCCGVPWKRSPPIAFPIWSSAMCSCAMRRRISPSRTHSTRGPLPLLQGRMLATAWPDRLCCRCGAATLLQCSALLLRVAIPIAPHVSRLDTFLPGVRPPATPASEVGGRRSSLHTSATALASGIPTHATCRCNHPSLRDKKSPTPTTGLTTPYTMTWSKEGGYHHTRTRETTKAPPSPGR